MSSNDPNEMTYKTSQGRTEGGFLGLLRAVALITLAVGAMGSLAFMFREGQQTPRFLLVLFTIWVLAPFVALLLANKVSKHWSVLTQGTLYCVTLIVALGSLAMYGEWINVKPPRSANAFLFVVVPPVSLLFIMISVAIASFISGRLSRRGESN